MRMTVENPLRHSLGYFKKRRDCFENSTKQT